VAVGCKNSPSPVSLGPSDVSCVSFVSSSRRHEAETLRPQVGRLRSNSLQIVTSRVSVFDGAAFRQKDTQTDRRTDTDRERDRHTHRKTDTQRDRQTETDRRTDTQTVSKTDRQTVRRTDRQTDRQSDRQTDSQGQWVFVSLVSNLRLWDQPEGHELNSKGLEMINRIRNLKENMFLFEGFS